MRQLPIGGERLHSGEKMQVSLHGYDSATFNLSKKWISTMSAGTLVPFLNTVALPGDEWKLDFNMDIKTLPAIGPMFGEFDWAIDMFLTPVRIYIPKLQMNMVDVGLEMDSVFLPRITWTSTEYTPSEGAPYDLDNSQTNPSSLMAYQGFRGGVFTNTSVQTTTNGLKFLMYWDIVKQYYANKQELNGWVIHTPQITIGWDITQIQIVPPVGSPTTIPEAPAAGGGLITNFDQIKITYVAGGTPNLNAVFLNTSSGQRISIASIGTIISDTSTVITVDVTNAPLSTIISWSNLSPTEITNGPIQLTSFPLKNIDKIKRSILSEALLNAPYEINNFGEAPYSLILGANQPANLSSQEGLAIKTYNSDFANNWIRTEFIDGPTGINAMSSVSTAGDEFTIDALIIHEKIYNMLNRVALSGGTYNDWQVAIYDTKPFAAASNPMYMGGLRKKLVFQEIYSNAEAGDGSQPLGTLAGKGIMSDKHKGGSCTINVGEMSYIIGIVSGTPRTKYSQGNAWDNDLQTMDDFFKPALNGIGFQDTPTNKFAWWSKQYDGTIFITRSAGKQTAWIDYQTNFDTSHGDFAIASNSMFMTLDRRYKPNETTGEIEDMTTYIDPSKYNYLFARTALDSQNFWVQIAMRAIVRRKMAANQIPGL